MSLPSRAIFINSDGEVMKRSFINCGWFFEERMIPSLLHDLKERDGYPDSKWSKVELYGVVLTYGEASNIYEIEKIRRNIIDLKKFVSKFHGIPDYQLAEVFETVIDLGNKLKVLSSNRAIEDSDNENCTS